MSGADKDEVQVYIDEKIGAAFRQSGMKLILAIVAATFAVAMAYAGILSKVGQVDDAQSSIHWLKKVVRAMAIKDGVDPDKVGGEGGD